MRRERVAVVGSGIAGLTAAYILQRKYDVTLLESAERLGGHSHTHDVATPDVGTIAIDSGFIVHNQMTYPLLCRLFAELGVETRETEMSMSVRCEGCGLEYAGAKGLRGVFAHPRSFVNVAYLGMLAQLPRFYHHARRAAKSASDELTLGEFLAEGGYSNYFVSHFVVPIVSCVWSIGPDTAREYPARYLFTFLENHGMLSIGGSPAWRTVVGGSRTYVDAIAKSLSAVATSTPVRSVVCEPESVTVATRDGERFEFERVVVATHADTALKMMSKPSDLQRQILGAFRYSQNDTVLHTSEAVLPLSPQTRSSWNFSLPSCSGAGGSAVVSYDMNRLQGISSCQSHVVTLNAPDAIDSTHVVARMRYEHPIYTAQALLAQRHLGELNGPRLAFAGAYHGWGFHEDGCRSGVQAARALGAEWPQ